MYSTKGENLACSSNSGGNPHANVYNQSGDRFSLLDGIRRAHRSHEVTTGAHASLESFGSKQAGRFEHARNFPLHTHLGGGFKRRLLSALPQNGRSHRGLEKNGEESSTIQHPPYPRNAALASTSTNIQQGHGRPHTSKHGGPPNHPPPRKSLRGWSRGRSLAGWSPRASCAPWPRHPSPPKPCTPPGPRSCRPATSGRTACPRGPCNTRQSAARGVRRVWGRLGTPCKDSSMYI